MGKLILCSQQNAAQLMRKNISVFAENGNITGNFGFLTTFSKLRVSTENVYRDIENFAAGVGTFIYKGQIGKVALKSILDDFNTVEEIQKSIVGSYCIVVFKYGNLYIFVDAASTYNIYYSLQNNNIVLSNTYYHVAKGLENITINRIGVTENWLFHAIDGTTPVKEISKLMGYQTIKYVASQWQVDYIDNKTNVPTDISTITSKSLVSESLLMYKSIPFVFKDCGIFMTGGQDSRLSLALLLALQCRLKLYYGIGNSTYSYTKQDDMKIVARISNLFSLPLYKMDWRYSAIEKKDMDMLIKKYGELSLMYCMNKNIISEFEEKINDEFVTFGYFGEVYRVIESIESYPKELYTLDNYLDDIYLKPYACLFKQDAYKEYKKNIKEQYLKVCAARNINIDFNNMTKKDFQKLNTLMRQRWDTEMNNFANQFFYSLPLFGNKILTDMVENVEYSKRKNSVFQMDCISFLMPQLLEIPFFSHIKTKYYNPLTHELTDKGIAVCVKDKLKARVGNKAFKKLIRMLYYIVRCDIKGFYEIKNQYKETENLKRVIQYAANTDFIDINCVYDALDAPKIKSLILLNYLLDGLEENYIANED